MLVLTNCRNTKNKYTPQNREHHYRKSINKADEQKLIKKTVKKPIKKTDKKTDRHQKVDNFFSRFFSLTILKFHHRIISTRFTTSHFRHAEVTFCAVLADPSSSAKRWATIIPSRLADVATHVCQLCAIRELEKRKARNTRTNWKQLNKTTKLWKSGKIR